LLLFALFFRSAGDSVEVRVPVASSAASKD
jgi:hypothetical protein